MFITITINSEMCSTSSGLTKPAYSFGVGKLVPALARVNESMPQIEPCQFVMGRQRAW